MVALIVGFVAVPNLISSSDGNASDLAHIDELPVVHTDEALGLDFTEPVLNASNTNARVAMKFNADITDASEELGSLTSHKWAFRLFSDAALRSEITTGAIQVGDSVRIHAYEETKATHYGVGAEQNSTLELKHSDDDWGLHRDYYLVRYVDSDGVELERPIVTRFNFAPDLEAPAVTAAEDPAHPGDLTLSWTPVEGAERYALVYGRSPVALGGEFDNTEQTLGLHYFYLGETSETSETSWSIGESFDAQADVFADRRNLGLEMPELDEDELLVYDFDDFVPTDLSGDEIGVVAIADDGTRSPLGTVNAAATISTLPAKLATHSYEAAVKSTQAASSGSEIAAPMFIPYVDFTGRIQHSPVTLTDAVSFGTSMRATLVSENGFELPYEAELGELSATELQQKVDAFNKSAADLAGNPGELLAVATSVIEGGAPQSEYEDTGLPTPTAASHPMVTYLAEHMLAGTLVIDVSEWVDQPGAPDTRHALREAAVQTPLAFVDYSSVVNGGNAVEVKYQHPDSERTQLQQQIHEAAVAIINDLGIEGTSDAEKITAFNDYLSATVEYDYEAYTVYPNADGHVEAYNLVGVLTEGTGVCAGYADAMNLFAQIAGIESVTISGKVVQGGNHAWNKFKVDGAWLSVDATWNDGDVPNHDYLLIADSEFTGSAERVEIDDRWVIPTYADLYATP